MTEVPCKRLCNNIIQQCSPTHLSSAACHLLLDMYRCNCRLYYNYCCIYLHKYALQNCNIKLYYIICVVSVHLFSRGSSALLPVLQTAGTAVDHRVQASSKNSLMLQLIGISQGPPGVGVCKVLHPWHNNTDITNLVGLLSQPPLPQY